MEPVKRKKLPYNTKRRRKRAPFASVAVALVLIIICIVFLGVNNWGRNPKEPEPEPTDTGTGISDPPSQTPVQTETARQSPSAAPHIPKPPPVKVRGMYINSDKAVNENNINRIIDICNNSDINAVVLDIKDESGFITFVSDTEDIARASYEYAGFSINMKKIISRLKEQGIYVIGRIVCLKDPIRYSINSENAIRDINGNVWKDDKDAAWLNPYKLSSWNYIADIAKEAVLLGFDEIQLDYVRFPADARIKYIDYGTDAAGRTKAETIGGFLEYISSELDGLGVWLSADVFGIIAVAKGDFEGIGQDLDVIMQRVDYVSPMIYPSHFANKGSNGTGSIINGILFEAPDKEPYNVVYNIMKTYKGRLSDNGDYAVVRPYLQAFTQEYLPKEYRLTYTADEVVAQIQAVYDAGFEEWIIWDHNSTISMYEAVGGLLSTGDSTAVPTITPTVTPDVTPAVTPDVTPTLTATNTPTKTPAVSPTASTSP